MENNATEIKGYCCCSVTYMKFTEKSSLLSRGRLISHVMVPPLFRNFPGNIPYSSLQVFVGKTRQTGVAKTGKDQPPSGPLRGRDNPPRM